MITFDFSPAVVKWAEKQLGENFGLSAGIGVVVDGIPAAAVVYSELRHGKSGNPHDIRASIVSVNKRWATRYSLSVLFAYPFHQLKVRRMTSVIAKRNKASRSLCERLGFRLEGTIRQGVEGDDLCVYGILKSEVKWLREAENRQVQPISARCA